MFSIYTLDEKFLSSLLSVIAAKYSVLYLVEIVVVCSPNSGSQKAESYLWCKSIDLSVAITDLDTTAQIHSKEFEAFKWQLISLWTEYRECLDSNLGATVKENKLGGWAQATGSK